MTGPAPRSCSCTSRRTDAPADRPEQELRRFAKVDLAPGESTAVTFELDDRCFSAWTDGGWVVPEGDFEVRVGRSSRDVRLRRRITP